jgi:hypothetical protein
MVLYNKNAKKWRYHRSWSPGKKNKIVTNKHVVQPVKRQKTNIHEGTNKDRDLTMDQQAQMGI